MKNRTYTNPFIRRVVRECDTETVAAVAARRNVPQNTLRRWVVRYRRTYGGVAMRRVQSALRTAGQPLTARQLYDASAHHELGKLRETLTDMRRAGYVRRVTTSAPFLYALPEDVA